MRVIIVAFVSANQASGLPPAHVSLRTFSCSGAGCVQTACGQYSCVTMPAYGAFSLSGVLITACGQVCTACLCQMSIPPQPLQQPEHSSAVGQ